MDQKDAQRHFAALIPATVHEKDLPVDFPYAAVDEAMKRCHLPGDSVGEVNKMPPKPGTAMPHLVRALLPTASGTTSIP